MEMSATNIECKKCKKNTSSVILRQKDPYCELCFIYNLNHKFRAVIGKHRILPKNQNVLLAVSGNLSSTVLMQLVHEGITLNNHKVLKVIPTCVFVAGLKYDDKFTEHLIKQCIFYGLDVHIVHISQYDQCIVHSESNSVPIVHDVDKEKLNMVLKKMTITEQKDFVSKIKRNLIIKVAQNLGCDLIFTAETATTLARNLLSNLALGRGAQIEHDIGFCDSRAENIKILRPMKDINKEELHYYQCIKKINPINKTEISDNSLQCLIQRFVVDLQDNYAATISTVCKTAEKIGSNDKTTDNVKCLLCQSNTSDKPMNLSAADATKFSRAVCFGSKDFVQTMNSSCKDENSSYCYACSRNGGLN